MPSAVPAPLIFSPRIEWIRLNWPGRLLAVGIGIACLSLLVTAARLEPSPTGIGTHTALGLERCDFERRTGLPCPSCGMTTSFAWFVRGNIVASLYCQPMGTVLASLVALTFWAGIYVGITGRPVHRLLAMFPASLYLMPLFVFGIAAWGWKIFIHLHGIDGWK